MDFNKNQTKVLHSHIKQHFNSLSLKELQKIHFIYNALENGWNVKKNEEAYIFRKKHNHTKTLKNQNYIYKFVDKNMKIDF